MHNYDKIDYSSERRYRAKREKPVTKSRGLRYNQEVCLEDNTPSTALQAELLMLAFPPDTSCPVTLVSLGIALQASDVID